MFGLFGVLLVIGRALLSLLGGQDTCGCGAFPTEWGWVSPLQHNEGDGASARKVRMSCQW